MKQIQTLLFRLLIAFVFNSILCAQQDSIVAQREARALVREGNKLYQKENYEDAAIAYRKALDKNSLYKKGNLQLWELPCIRIKILKRRFLNTNWL